MVLLHEFPFDIPFEQLEQGLHQMNITGQSRSLAWKLAIDHAQFR